MTVIDFPGYGQSQTPCNYEVLRSTNWNMPTGFIADETRAGTRRVRPANADEPETYSVTLRFKTLADYTTFDYWYRVTDRKGLFAFNFRDLKKKRSANQSAVYRFVQNGGPNPNNTAGEIMDVSMSWEEV